MVIPANGGEISISISVAKFWVHVGCVEFGKVTQTSGIQHTGVMGRVFGCKVLGLGT